MENGATEFLMDTRRYSILLVDTSKGISSKELLLVMMESLYIQTVPFIEDKSKTQALMEMVF